MKISDQLLLDCARVSFRMARLSKAKAVPALKSLRGQLEAKLSPSLKTPNFLVGCFRADVDIPVFNLLATYSCAGN
jgi:hypothetical protein